MYGQQIVNKSASAIAGVVRLVTTVCTVIAASAVMASAVGYTITDLTAVGFGPAGVNLDRQINNDRDIQDGKESN